jgi:serine/threonine protein phosphatase PrpC
LVLGYSYAGLFDGHGGAFVSKLLQKKFLALFEQNNFQTKETTFEKNCALIDAIKPTFIK